MANGEPMPPEAAGQPAEGGAPADGGGDIGQMVQGISQGLGTMGELIAATPGAPEGAIQKIKQIQSDFQSLIAELGGGAPQEATPAKGRAVPAPGPQGTPQTPAGV